MEKLVCQTSTHPDNKLQENFKDLHKAFPNVNYYLRDRVKKEKQKLRDKEMLHRK
jgi:hypothetical protein